MFGARRGYFLPYRYAADLPTAGGCPPYPAIEAVFASNRPAFIATLARTAAYTADLAAIDSADATDARWDQDWFPRLDAAVAYSMVRDHRPRNIIEVGSGHSSRFLARAVRDGQLSANVLAIDPAPRTRLPDAGIDLRAETVQGAGLTPFEALTSGDILFVDSSHILMPGSDVDFLLNAVLPMLHAGVLIHFHDIFLPDGYPAEWEWRGYNEQSAVASLLQGDAYELIFASHYAATRLSVEVGHSPVARLFLPPGARESSLWLRKVTTRQSPKPHAEITACEASAD